MPPARRAANDDRQSIGQILQSLQRRPPRTSYLVATLFALAWVAGGAILTWIFLPDLQSTFGQSSVALLGVAAIVLAPIVFFFVLAHMVWRAQELRLIAQSMANVAMRLAEPEGSRARSIVSVGQAIRREAAAMGDGVERRACTRRRTRDARCQRGLSLSTYHDNEAGSAASSKIYRVSAKIWSRNPNRSARRLKYPSRSHRDITSTTDAVAPASTTARKIAKALGKGEHITLALSAPAAPCDGTLSERGGDILERLERTSQETTAIAAASIPSGPTVFRMAISRTWPTPIPS